MIPKSYCQVLNFVSSGIENATIDVTDNIDWEALFRISEEQSVTALCVDSIQRSKEIQNQLTSLKDSTIRKSMSVWFCNSLSYECRYRSFFKVIDMLSEMCVANKLKMLIIKGLSLSRFYPRPHTRMFDDIDVYFFGNGQLVNDIIRSMGISVCTNGNKHSEFIINGVLVENHASIVDVRDNKAAKVLERFLEYEPCVESEWPNVYYPSANFYAAYLPFHFASHFVFDKGSLKQLVDWPVLLKACGDKIDWDRVVCVADKIGYMPLLKTLNSIAVDYLGCPSSVVPSMLMDSRAGDLVMEDILMPPNIQSGVFNFRLLKSIKSFFCGYWKYKLVYRQSFVVNFGVHVMNYTKRIFDIRPDIWE